jgi:hypothetical protein
VWGRKKPRSWSQERKVMESTKEPQKRPKYTKPEVTDLGDLRELTATNNLQLVTDVPSGGPLNVAGSNHT